MYVFADTRFIKHSLKIFLAWTERCNNIISNLSNNDSTIIQKHFHHCFNVFIGYWQARATRTSIIIDICSASSLNRLYRNWTCVLLIEDSPNAVVNISNVFEHLISVFCTKLNTTFLIHFFEYIVKNRIKEHTKTRLTFLSVKNKLTIQNGWHYQHI